MNNVAKEISTLVESIIEVSRKYWLSHTSKSEYSRFSYELIAMSLITRLMQKESSLKKYGIKIDNRIVINLRRSLTLSSKNYHKENEYSFTSIIQESTKLINHLESKISQSNLQGIFSNQIKNQQSKLGVIFGLFIVILFFGLLLIVKNI